LSEIKETVDGRFCEAICTTNPEPGAPGAPDPPP